MLKKIWEIIALSAWVLIGSVGTACAASGDIDPSFGSQGKLAYSGELIPMPDGRLAVAVTVDAGFEVRMLDEGGRPDPTYGESGIAQVSLRPEIDWFNNWSAAVGADGSLAFHGGVRLPGRTVRAVLKIDPTGHPDAGFGADGQGIALIEDLPPEVTTLSRLAIQADGGVLVTGDDQYYDYCSESGAVLRLSPDGGVDTGFGTNGWASINGKSTCGIEFLGVRADGSIIVAGGGDFWALKSDGKPDTTFGIDGRLTNAVPGFIDGVLLRDGGFMLVAETDGFTATRLARLNATGQLDTTFGHSGTLDIDFGQRAFSRSGVAQTWPRLVLSPDGQSALLPVHLSAADRPRRHVRCLFRPGRPELSFGSEREYGNAGHGPTTVVVLP